MNRFGVLVGVYIALLVLLTVCFWVMLRGQQHRYWEWRMRDEDRRQRLDALNRRHRAGLLLIANGDMEATLIAKVALGDESDDSIERSLDLTVERLLQNEKE